MASNTDILLDDDGDLLIVDGDFVIGESNNQHCQLIFECQKGEIRVNPSLGFGALSYLKSMRSSADFKRSLRVELNRDGYTNIDISITQDYGKLTVNIQ